MLCGNRARRPVLFLLAHATGSAFRYAELLPGLSGKADVVPLDLPGHGARRGEPLLRSMEGIREDLAGQAAGALDARRGVPSPGAPPEGREAEGGPGGRPGVNSDGAAAAAADGGASARAGEAVGERVPYCVFGHSMGVVNGYVMTERLMESGYGPPERFFASSFSVPGWHPIPPGMPELPDVEMWLESAARFGVLNGQPVPSPETVESHSPVYRADLKAVEGYKPERLTALPCPVTVVYAESDMVDYGLAARWEGLTPYPPEIIRVPGGHFHPLELPGQLQGILLERL
ncbi:MAG: alpha/beta fold hydrolase [Deltaproteobacteria bacterium]|nr:alpha/beta fold hydrolase [Deltaproteobacteria bacterium]